MAKFSALVDDFNGGPLNTAVWEPSTFGSGTVGVVAAQLSFVTPVDNADFVMLQSVNTYDLTGSSISIQLADAGDQTIPTLDIGVLAMFDPSGGNNIGWYLGNGILYTPIEGLQRVFEPYNPAVHRWFRLRESGGIHYYDYAPDGINWITAAVDLNSFDLTAMTLYIYAGTDSPEAASTTVIFDNVNVLPAVPQVSVQKMFATIPLYPLPATRGPSDNSVGAALIVGYS